jgi:hypothetical protein
MDGTESPNGNRVQEMPRNMGNFPDNMTDYARPRDEAFDRQ